MSISLWNRALFLIVIFTLTGCLESSFELSKNSRLPKWFIQHEDFDRSKYSVTMDLYSTFSGGKDVFKLYQKDSFLSVQKFTVTTDMQPEIRVIKLQSSKENFPKGYPKYKVVTINSFTEIIEFRKMEPVFIFQIILKFGKN